MEFGPTPASSKGVHMRFDTNSTGLLAAWELRKGNFLYVIFVDVILLSHGSTDDRSFNHFIIIRRRLDHFPLL